MDTVQEATPTGDIQEVYSDVQCRWPTPQRHSCSGGWGAESEAEERWVSSSTAPSSASTLAGLLLYADILQICFLNHPPKHKNQNQRGGAAGE